MKGLRIVRLAMFAIVGFGGVGTVFADVLYTFTTIGVLPGAVSYGINDSGQIVGSSGGAFPHGFLYRAAASPRSISPGLSSLMRPRSMTAAKSWDRSA